jgi:hypothetical protein
VDFDFLRHRVKVIALLLKDSYSIVVPEIPEVTLNFIVKLLINVFLLVGISALILHLLDQVQPFS